MERWGSQSWHEFRPSRAVLRTRLTSPTKIMNYLKRQRQMQKMISQYPHTGHPEVIDVHMQHSACFFVFFLRNKMTPGEEIA